jgi:hypothetical protein
MIAGERLSRTEGARRPAAVLARIVVAREQERVGDLPAEPSRHVNELCESNDERARERKTRGADQPVAVGLDNFGLAVNDQPERTA